MKKALYDTLSAQSLPDLACYYTKEHGDFILFYNRADQMVMIMHKDDWADIVKWGEDESMNEQYKKELEPETDETSRPMTKQDFLAKLIEFGKKLVTDKKYDN